MVVEISSHEELKAWLEGKPRQWVQVIALRCALRVLPFALDTQNPLAGAVDRTLTKAVFRAMSVSSGAAKIPPDDTSAARAAAGYDDVWQSIADDCVMLERGGTITALLAAPLWSNGLPEWLGPVWARATEWLTVSSEGFDLWRDWYARKLRGERFEFAGFDDAAEREFFSRLFAQGEDWWDREPAAVNADIAGWVAELARPKLIDADLEQNPVVINFALDAEGRTILAPEPLPNGLQDGPDARDTHAEIRRLNAEARLASDHGSTQATDMVGPLDLLGEAVGARVEDVRPRLLVLRGKEIIRQFEARQRDDPIGLPLSVAQINTIAPLIEAVKQFADEDSKLRKLWQGPDSEGPVLTKRQIDLIIDALDETARPSRQRRNPSSSWPNRSRQMRARMTPRAEQQVRWFAMSFAASERGRNISMKGRRALSGGSSSGNAGRKPGRSCARCCLKTM